MKCFIKDLLLPSLLIFFTIIFCHCDKSNPSSEVPDRQVQVEQVARDFFATFAERKDWEKFCNFYREDLEFDDVTLQIHLDSLWQFKRFYKWDEEGDAFQKLTPDQDHLTIETLVVNDSVAVGRGHLNPFYYHGELIDTDWGMEVVFWLYFDENLKIKKQVDWIEYDPKVLDGILKHYREKGVDELPKWLDLSKG